MAYRRVKPTDMFKQRYFPLHKPEIHGLGDKKARRGKIPTVPFDLAVAQVIPRLSADSQVVRIRLQKLCRNQFLNKFYYQAANFWCFDERKVTRPGDIVLIERAKEPPRFNTVYSVAKVVFRFGEPVDPCTNTVVTGPNYTVGQLEQLVSKLSTGNSRQEQPETKSSQSGGVAHSSSSSS